MNPDVAADSMRDFFDGLTHVDWLGTAIACVIIVLATMFASFLMTRFIHSIMGKGKNKLPQSTIFVNVARVAVWIIGLSILLSSCFDINVGAMFTALGIGGIAISLGFQDTLSNLIGGLQVSLSGLLKPGDHVTVGSNVGVVRDITWRHTSIVNSSDQVIVVPNSVINSQALIKMRPTTYVSLPMHVTTVPDNGGLDTVATDIENAANTALNKACISVKKPAAMTFSGVTDRSFTGSLSFTVHDSRDTSKATDLVLRAVAPYVHASFFSNDFAPDVPAPEPAPKKCQATQRTPKQQQEHQRKKGTHRYRRLFGHHRKSSSKKSS